MGEICKHDIRFAKFEYSTIKTAVKVSYYSRIYVFQIVGVGIGSVGTNDFVGVGCSGAGVAVGCGAGVLVG